MDGSVDMMCMFISGTYDPRFNITSFPVILQNWDDAKKQNAEDSNYTKILTEACADNNMVYLGTHVDGFCGVSSVKEPQNYADPTKPKGCLIRCVTNEKSKQLLEAQGYQSHRPALGRHLYLHPVRHLRRLLRPVCQRRVPELPGRGEVLHSL